MADFQEDNSGAGPSGPGSFDSVVNGTPQLVGPPPTPEAKKERESGWAALFEGAKNNPALGLALINAGAMLASPRQFNQSRTGHLLSSVAQGANMYTGLNRDQEDQALKVQEQGRKQQETDSGVKLQGAQTGQVQATTQSTEEKTKQLKASFPLELQKLEQEISSAKTLDQLRGAQTRAQNIQSQINETYGGKEADAKIDLTRAQTVDALAQSKYREILGQKATEEIGILKDSQKGYQWQLIQDKTTGDFVRQGYNKSTGELVAIRDKNPMPLPDAIAAAKADVKAALTTAGGFMSNGPDKESVLKQFGGATDEKTAIANKAAEYQKGGVTVQRYKNGQLVDNKFRDQDAHSMELGLAPDSPEKANQYLARLQQIQTLTKGGQNKELLVEGDRLATALTKAGVQFDTRSQQQGGTGNTPPPEVLQVAKENKGKSGVFAADDGTKWRIEKNGQIQQQVGGAPATPQAPAATMPQPNAAPLPTTGADVIQGVIKGLESNTSKMIFSEKANSLKTLKAEAMAIQAEMATDKVKKDQNTLVMMAGQYGEKVKQIQALEAELKPFGITVQ